MMQLCNPFKIMKEELFFFKVLEEVAKLMFAMQLLRQFMLQTTLLSVWHPQELWPLFWMVVIQHTPAQNSHPYFQYIIL